MTGQGECTASVMRTDGEVFDVLFRLERWKRGNTYYLAGDFNARGTGSLSFREGRCIARMLWGRYRFKVLENQYDVLCRGVLSLPQEKGVYHNPSLRTYLDISEGTIFIRLRAVGSTDRAFLLTGGRRIEMGRDHFGTGSRYFHLAIDSDMRSGYSFEVIHGSRREKYGDFPAPRLEETTPAWVHSSVFYEVFPDRFCRSGKRQSSIRGLSGWGEKPAMGRFFGGNLSGLSGKLRHIKSLGANAVYSTPVFTSSTEHRYDTGDYSHIDPLLGSNEEFIMLLKRMHSRGIRFVADAVLNHSGTGFSEFPLFLEGKSRWYIRHGKPALFPGRHDMRHPPASRPAYETWEGVGMLPKFNLSLAAVRGYLTRVLTGWTADAGIDGWRFDVGDSLPPDFISELRIALRKVNGDAYMLGEVWRDPSFWFLLETYDGTMNYTFRKGIVDFTLGAITGRRLSNLLSRYSNRQPQSALLSGYNLLGSHDTARIRSVLGTRRRVEFAYALLFSLPGAPAIYYGDEFSMRGTDAPSARGTVDWGARPELAEFFSSLSKLRRENRPLTSGDSLYRGTESMIEVIRPLPGKTVMFQAAVKRLARRKRMGEVVLLSHGANVNGGRISLERYGWCFTSYPGHIPTKSEQMSEITAHSSKHH